MGKIKLQKKIASVSIAICATLMLVVPGIVYFYVGGDKATSANSLAEITESMLPSSTATYVKTTQTVEDFELKSGRIYKFEVWGARGGHGTIDELAAGFRAGTGGNGSYAYGWYDMREKASAVAQIFAGGMGGSLHRIFTWDPVEMWLTTEYVELGNPGWSATQLNSQLMGTRAGGYFESYYGLAGGGGGASGIYLGSTPLIVAGGGGGGGQVGDARGKGYNGGNGGGSTGGNGEGIVYGYDYGGKGATQSAHGAGGYTASGNHAGTDTAGGTNGHLPSGSAGGGAGGGYKRGFAGGAGSGSELNGKGSGGGGSGGTSYTDGVQSLSDKPKGFEWAKNGGVGKVQITEFVMAVNVSSPTSTEDYLTSSPSEPAVPVGGSYTFTITRTIGTGHIGLLLNIAKGTLELTSTNGNVFTYTVSDVQGSITADDFSVTTFNVEAPPDGAGYTISSQSLPSVLIGGSYVFVITLNPGYACPMVSINTTNGKVNYSGTDADKMTVTISNVIGDITADDFTIFVSRII